ncbi:MAG TPA: cation acetate symporter, partial [Desulfovibrio sp.]|nr:cation acetate symporter [Desulfovibrio sp.]
MASEFSSTIGQPNALSIGFFFLFVAFTLGVTWWAARRSRSAAEFYAAGRSVTGFQ